MRLQGEPPLKDGEGIFIGTTGKHHVIARGMVGEYKMDMGRGAACEFTVVLVGAIFRQETK